MKSFKVLALTALMALLGSAPVLAGEFIRHSAEGSVMRASDLFLPDTQQPPQNIYGEDSVACVENWSLYAEYYRQNSYDLAYPYWKYMYESCPRATRNIYIHGANMLRSFFAVETDPQRQEAWLDTLFMLYDQRIEYYPEEEGSILGRKASEMYQFRANNVQELFDLTEKSIGIMGMLSEANVLLINFQTTIRMVEAGLLDANAILEHFERAEEIIEYNLENNPEDARYYEPAKEALESLFEPYATCDSLVRMFTDRYEENPNDVELLQRITQMFEQARCTDKELFYLATRNLHQIEPSAESAFLMARLETSLENFQSAIDYYQQAVDLYQQDPAGNNADRIFLANLQMADISYRQLRRMPQARTYALRAHGAVSTDGRPLLLIGEMYAASASDCGDNDFTSKTAFWAAVDKFEEARNATNDPAIEERANQLINTYRQYFPDNESIFFQGFSEGETYRVECWINETTRIRPR